MTDEPVERLLRIADGLAAGRPVPGADGRWFADAVARWLRDGEPLALALDLQAIGPDDARRRWLRSQRDSHLRAAWMLCTAPTPWARSRLLADHVSRFETDVWPRLKIQAGPPADSSRLRRHLDAAFRTGLEVPTSARQLHRIAATEAHDAMSEVVIETVLR